MVKFRLKEVVNSIVSGITINHCSKGTYPVYGSTGIIGYTNTHDYSGERILIARVGANAGATNIVCGEYGVSDNTLVITVDSEYETKYIYYYLKHKKLNQFVFGSSQPLITGSLLKNISLYIPDKMSQQHIVKALSDVDGVISSLEKLIAKYKSIKAACLQQMFPQNGETVPRMRLPGFTDDWEQRKLGDISEIKTGPFGSTLHADDYVSDGIPIITTEHFKTGALPRSKNGLPQVSDADYKRLTSYTLNDGDIVFSRVGSVDINALITPFQSNWLFSGRVLRVRPRTDISSQFLHTRLETESIKSDIRARAVGQTMPSINTEILKITPLVLPTSAAEQEQIGSYFAAIDNLITLHQRKLKKVQKIKQGMMQQLLTGKIRLV